MLEEHSFGRLVVASPRKSKSFVISLIFRIFKFEFFKSKLNQLGTESNETEREIPTLDDHRDTSALSDYSSTRKSENHL